MSTDKPESGRPWWLNRTATVALAGLAFSVVFAVGIGWYIPNKVAEEFLAAQAAADRASLDFLISSEVIASGSDIDVAVLDEFVRQSILRGDFVRAKLWGVDGTILYSDAPALIGSRFEPDEEFADLTEPVSDISDLSADENVLEVGQFNSLLETYIPVLDGDNVLAVWEIYRTLDAYNASVDQTRRLVWMGVASGLGLLGIFLVAALGLLVRTADEQKLEAEAHLADLERLLEVAQANNEFDDPEMLGERLGGLLATVPHVVSAKATATTVPGGERVLLDVISEAPPTDSQPPPVQVKSQLNGGSVEVTVHPRSAGCALPTVQALAEEVHLGLQNALLTEGVKNYRNQLEHVMQQLVTVHESERQRLAGEVHDGLAQDLFRILYGVRGLASGASGKDAELIGEIEAVVLQTSQTLRSLLRDLHPTVAEDVALGTALGSLVELIEDQHGIKVLTDLDRCPDAEDSVKLAVYRVIQEALVNVSKHSGDASASLAVWSKDDRIHFDVIDHGRGLGADWQPGMGVWLMRERVESLGGEIEFASDHGTKISVSIPTGLPV